MKTVLEDGICNSNVESWFLRSEENREKQAMKNRGGKDQPGRDGHGERVVTSIPLMFHLSCLMKLTSKDKFPSPFKDLVPDPKSQ